MRRLSLPLLAVTLSLGVAACGDKDGDPGDGVRPLSPNGDADGDGSLNKDDCDPLDAKVRPGGHERCNGKDDDCDGEIDEEVVDGRPFYPDADGDGFGAGDDRDVVVACGAGPAGYALTNNDCDDGDPGVHSGAAEGCDGVDSNCDGEAGPLEVDRDGDGALACADCDDTDPAVFPGAPERCNYRDDDCDEDVDEGVAWFPDADGDGYGDPSGAATAGDCGDGVPGYAPNGDDCDDADPAISPDADEVCDSLDVDEDCDGLADDADDSLVGGVAVAPDDDGDGYGDASRATTVCAVPSGVVTAVGDCDDTDPAIHPGAAEGLLAADVNCDGAGGGDLSGADVRLLGERGGDRAGLSVAGAGDVDGDGLADVIVGAQYSDRAAPDAGATYLVSGRTLAATGGLGLASADVILDGQTSLDWSGYAVAGVGDVDGDGLDDVLVGATGQDRGDYLGGAAYLVTGASLSAGGPLGLASADVVLLGEATPDMAGTSVAGAGDVDGDGLADLLVGAWQNGDGGGRAGKAYLLFGASLATLTSVDLSTADHAFVGEASRDGAGAAVASAGDVDGDGLDDILIGAPGQDAGGTDAGRAYLFLAASLGTSRSLDLSAADFVFEGEVGDDALGTAVGSAGDVDGDGLADVLIGAPGSADGGPGAGKVALFLGRSLTAPGTVDVGDADFTLVGAVRDGGVGRSVAGLGDLDGDGLDDVAVAGDLVDTSASGAGAVYVVLGRSLGSSATVDLAQADFRILGTARDDAAGTGLGAAGDVDGDGRPDLVIGAGGSDDAASNAGQAYVILNGL